MKATATHVEAAAIDVKDFVKSSVQIMQVQSHLVCVVNEAYDSDDTDDEKILSENYDEIDVLTALIENDHKYEKSSKTLDKSKNIVQEHIEKKK